MGAKDPLVGKIIAGRYRVLRRTARDIHTVTFDVQNEHNGTPASLKLLRADVSGPQQLARFRREAKVYARLESPHLLKVIDFGQHENTLYMVSEPIVGRPLQQLLAEGPIGELRSMRILAQVASALGAAHAQGIVHRNLRPSTVFVDGPDGKEKARIIDFGFAAMTDEAREGAGQTLGAMVTGEGDYLGDPSYSAPEIFTGLDITPGTDLYSMGCLAYHCLTGRPPFVGSMPKISNGHVNVAPTPFSELDPPVNVDSTVEEFVFQLLEKKTESRPADASEVFRRLKKIELGASMGEFMKSLPPPSSAPGDAPSVSVPADATGGVKPVHVVAVLMVVVALFAAVWLLR